MFVYIYPLYFHPLAVHNLRMKLSENNFIYNSIEKNKIFRKK